MEESDADHPYNAIACLVTNSGWRESTNDHEISSTKGQNGEVDEDMKYENWEDSKKSGQEGESGKSCKNGVVVTT